MLPLSLFRMRAFSTAACAGLLVNLVFFGLIFAFSLFLQRQQGLSPLATGLAFLPVTVLIVVSNLVAGRILPARGTRAVAWAGALLMGAGCLAMLALLGARVGPLVPTLIAGLSLTGFGIGLVVTAVTSALLGSVAPAQSGIASGAFTAFRQTGSVLGVALFGTLLGRPPPVHRPGSHLRDQRRARCRRRRARPRRRLTLRPARPASRRKKKRKRRHMWNCRCPDDNAPLTSVTPARDRSATRSSAVQPPSPTSPAPGSSPTRLSTYPATTGTSARPSGTPSQPSCSGTPTSSCSATVVTEVSRNSGLPPSRMAKRLFEEQPRPKVKSDDDVPHG